ncbi:hypothetical protein NVV94_18155 [Pseudomonas sp. LS1212]|uniref:hypothetical protein n=1 Tax=Pseudomonas sp. LS1212 TaxID=2972478 RepID=UPI00215BE5FA|nr:hypothetical protein [Pseudomonas sp. LS1212]UVJ42537.1 hypothetical protein NVV94_18155 [Pseudomonas sp. LS1212]
MSTVVKENGPSAAIVPNAAGRVMSLVVSSARWQIHINPTARRHFNATLFAPTWPSWTLTP